MVTKLYYDILLTLIYRSSASILDFPLENIRRLPLLDVIGGYPSFLRTVYVRDGFSVVSSIKPKFNRYVALSTFLPFNVKKVDCSNSTSISSECEVICSMHGLIYTTAGLYKFSMPKFVETDFGNVYNVNFRSDPNCAINRQAEGTVVEKEIIGGYFYGNEVRISGRISLLKPDTSGLCTHFHEQPIMYRVNYTASCRWHFHAEKGCDSDELVKFLSNQINGTEVCDKRGDRCVPILRDRTLTSSDKKCDNYSVMSVSLATQQGLILGMLIEFIRSPNRCRENYCILTTKISFQEVTQQFLDKMKLSRYENSEGRFRCPSEITCLAELFYFLDIFDLKEFSAQFFVLIPLLVLLLLYVS